MCRWFAYLSPTEPCLLSDVLITPKHALTNQVNDHYLPRLIAHLPDKITAEHEANARNRILNADGLGVAWYTTSYSDFEKGITGESEDGKPHEGLRPAVYKTIQPPKGDMNYRSICANTETRCCFAHIRATSASAVTQVNNHPFLFGRITFMHNGAISDFIDIRRGICDMLDPDTYANIQGSTDSEHIGALFVHYLSEGRGKDSWDEDYSVHAMATAIRIAVKTIIDLQKEILGAKRKPNSLNLAATDGTKMIACRFRNHAIEQPPSLYYSTRAGVTLNRKYPDHADGKNISDEGPKKSEDEHGNHVIVASEPSTYIDEDWELIGKNQYLLVNKDGKAIIQNMMYGQTWDADDEEA
ncbi:N-terminal nucleophile aminohydrolase [Aureobasidium pullulans]|uniref:N-terminal nucleophile aminohydrolase n=1 Tax=Aureobasidium pullulans TaxID=5580 RepID=A0A4S9P6S2_AURPU|nr:N-terminal nucleophile aminohydrolase [Aureobasidium pullulans]THZ13093.1 N-terminal nucleophile aminohydrolase [Aureobasidium pullulans]